MKIKTQYSYLFNTLKKDSIYSQNQIRLVSQQLKTYNHLSSTNHRMKCIYFKLNLSKNSVINIDKLVLYNKKLSSDFVFNSKMNYSLLRDKEAAKIQMIKEKENNKSIEKNESLNVYLNVREYTHLSPIFIKKYKLFCLFYLLNA